MGRKVGMSLYLPYSSVHELPSRASISTLHVQTIAWAASRLLMKSRVISRKESRRGAEVIPFFGGE